MKLAEVEHDVIDKAGTVLHHSPAEDGVTSELVHAIKHQHNTL